MGIVEIKVNVRLFPFLTFYDFSKKQFRAKTSKNTLKEDKNEVKKVKLSTSDFEVSNIMVT